MDFKSAHEGFIGPINKKSAQGAFFVSEIRVKKIRSTLYRISPSIPLTGWGTLQPDIGTPFRVPVSANIISILVTQICATIW